MYQKTSREIFKCLKAAAVFLLALVLLLPAMPETVQAADDDDVLLDVPYFDQGDYTKHFTYPDGSTVWSRDDKTNEIVGPAYVAISGCGAASSAMVVDYYRKSLVVDPEDMFQRAVDKYYYSGHGLSHDAITYICSSDSVLVTWSSSIDEVINAIKDGRPVISHMGPGTFTKHGHYIVLIGYRKDSDGNEYFQVNDPNHPQFCGVEYKRSIITSETKGNGWGITVDVGVKKLTVSPAMDSTALQVKKSCNITGYVASNVKLAEVKGEIIDSTGKTIQSATVNPNASYLDLKSSDVNMNLKFGTLSEGFYTLKITGKDINNITQYKTISFTVGNPSPDPSIVTPDPDSLLAVNDLSLDTRTITKGRSCNINGTVTSNYVIKSVKGEILDSSNKPVQTVVVYPNSKFLNLKASEVNMNLKFGNLAVGSYNLKITVTDSKKSTSYLYKFNIVNPSTDPASTLAITSLKAEKNAILVGNACNILGTVSSNYSITSIRGEFLDNTGKTVQAVTIYPNRNSVDLKSSDINMKLACGKLAAGNYTLRVTASDVKKTVSSGFSFTVQPQADPASTLAISSLKTEKNPILAGNACNVLGTVSSNYNITKVVGSIINASGTTVQTVTITPNAKSVDLKSTDVNMKLSLGKLSAGNYTLKVTATDAKKTVSSGYSFTVQPQADPASTLAISSLKTEKNPILAGNACNVLGTVSSNYNITKVVGSIINASGTTVQTVTITPNAKSVDLKSTDVNMKLSLGKLSAGNYTLKVTATDAKKTVSSGYSFTVQPQADPASTLAISSLKTENSTITTGNGCNILGTITSNYNITKVVGSIVNASGTTVQTVTITPNTRSVDLKSTDVNMKLAIGKLTAGTYQLKVTATDTKKSVSATYTFYVKDPEVASTLAISSLKTESSTITTGNGCNILGTVASNYNITKVVGSIVNASGTTVQTVTITPNAKSVDLKSTDVNMKLAIGKLTAGTYQLKVTATDTKKSVSASYTFYVKDPEVASTLAISSLKTESNPVTAGTGCNILGTVASNYTITKVEGFIINSSGTTVQSVSITPNAKSVDLKSTDINMKLALGKLAAGGYTLRVTATDTKKSTTANYTFTVKNPDVASTLAISLGMDATTITAGNGCNITGTVSSNYTITTITGSFINSSGTTVQTVSISPNSKTVDLKSTDINMKLAFGKLAAGNYTLKVVATDSKKSVSSSKSFTIKNADPASTLAVSLGLASTTIQQGNGCNITGSVSSNYNISSVTGSFINSSGSVVQTVTVYPNSKSLDIKNSDINMKLTFGSLAPGNYTLRVTAYDAKTSASSSKSFTIQGTSVAGLSGSVSMATTSVSYGSGCDITGSFSSGSKITSVVGKIINSSGSVVQSETIYPNSYSVDLKSSAINSNLRFGKLARGGYTLQVTATDAAGKTLTRNVTFSVK